MSNPKNPNPNDVEIFRQAFQKYNTSNFKKKVRLELERELSFSVDEQEATAQQQYYLPYIPPAENSPIRRPFMQWEARSNPPVAATQPEEIPEEIVEDVLFD